jgi:hypothetical protein
VNTTTPLSPSAVNGSREHATGFGQWNSAELRYAGLDHEASVRPQVSRCVREHGDLLLLRGDIRPEVWTGAGAHSTPLLLEDVHPEWKEDPQLVELPTVPR